ncbi:tectonic-1-like [Polyergus mexicanus]|uniref:tectonic-1-like n=1 Tax=Polyergus mexicanus TaxID=615972 RepID=UPI0038B5EDCC
MFFLLVLILAYTNMVYLTKFENTLICINDTNCGELIDSTTHTQNPTVNDLSTLEISSNDIEENNPFTTIIPIEITSSKINSNVTEQEELELTSITISSPAVYPDNDEVLILEEKEICECNLIKFSCDINCCCDPDCNQFHLSAFSHCQNYHVKVYDSRYCYNRNFILRNNTAFILEKLGNNLFCILYDNLPPTYNVDNDLVINSEKDLWRVIQNKYKWKIEVSTGLPKYNLSKYYQHGDILWKLHNKSIESIDLLQPGFTEICSFKKTLRYLENWKGACIQNNLTNMNRYLFAMTFNNFTVIKSLPLFNDTFIRKQACQSNICLSMRTHYCQNSFSACNETKISSFCINSTCTNIVKGLKYVITHNGSAGISNIDAYFNIGNTSHAFYQYFEVQYNWIDANKTKVFTRSGNPGYIMGKPIIFGISRANKSNEIFFNKTDGFLTLPLAGKNGECDQINRHIIAFGEDVKLRCSARLLIKNFTTLSCAELQNLTMRLLMKDSLLNASQHYSAYVSKLGNIAKKDTIDWLQIVFDRIPQNIVTAHTIGKRILCSGLLTSMHFNVLYSKLPAPKTLTNHKILSVGITFGKEEDISWSKCIPKNCTDILDIDIISHVNFYDVSKPSKYHFVDGPNLDIMLPYDFFYPFLNCSKEIEMLNIFVLLVIYLVLHANI